LIKLIGLDFETVAKCETCGKVVAECTCKEFKGVHQFYSFQAYSEDAPKCKVFSTNPEDFLRFLTEKYENAWFVTFNLAFDGIVTSRILEPYDYTVNAVFAGSRMVRMTIRKGKRKWILMDLRNVFPNTNLAKIGDCLNYKKLDKPSYLGRRAPQGQEEMAYFYQYAMRDAEICYKMAALIREEFKCFKSTCAGLAIRVFKRDFCHIRKFPTYSDILNDKLRQAYHGGRTECFIRGVNTEKVKVYDVRSLYPYVMRTKPYPNICEDYQHLATVDLDKEGIAHVNITQDCNFPPIAIKYYCEDGLEKLVFPNGTFDAWCTYPELRALESSNSGKINKVYEAYQWQTKFNPFEQYVDTMYAKKEQATIELSPKKMLYKIMLNGTYGKFGEHGTCTFAVFKGDRIVESVTPPSKPSWYHSVPIAAYITSYARLHTWSLIKVLNPDGVYYTDTDCAHTTQNLDHLCGTKLGMLQLEKEANAYQACYIRSKFYMLGNAVTMKGFCCHDDATAIKTAIFKNDFKHFEHRITKILEAQRQHKPALFEYALAKRFTIEQDGKRNFKQFLDNRTILTEQAQSTPIEVHTQ
jgi:hypothetical protein